MQRKSFPGSHAVVLAAFALTLMAACADTPTEQSAVFADGGVASSTIGDPGVTDGVPQSATSVSNAEAFPSTNEANIGKAWAHVTWNSNDAGVGEAPLKFTSTRAFSSCFEIRIDDEPPLEDPHLYWPERYLDGSWEVQCVSNSTTEELYTATSHVDVRMSLGAEGDERFDWTRFYVMSVQSKDECRNGGWQELGFANQGHCIRYVETGRL